MMVMQDNDDKYDPVDDEDHNVEGDYNENNEKDGCDEDDDYADDASIKEDHDQLLVFNCSELPNGPHSLDHDTHMKSDLSWQLLSAQGHKFMVEWGGRGGEAGGRTVVGDQTSVHGIKAYSGAFFSSLSFFFCYWFSVLGSVTWGLFIALVTRLMTPACDYSGRTTHLHKRRLVLSVCVVSVVAILFLMEQLV